MSRRKLVLAALGVVVTLAAAGGYVWFEYDRAQIALSRARTNLWAVEAALHRDHDIGKAEANFTLAKIEVEALERSHATWFSRADLAALRKELEAYKKEIEERQGRPADDKPEAKVTFHRDLVYCEKHNLQLDLARPPGDGPFPAIVCIHSGGWGFSPVAQNHKGPSYQRLIGELGKQGYVAVAIGFRKLPDHRFPVPVHDIKCAVRWLRANADKYKIDRERIAALGHSSGGHLACMLGTTSPKDSLEGDGGHADQSSRVQCVICCCGLLDLDQARQNAWWGTRMAITSFLHNPLQTAHLTGACFASSTQGPLHAASCLPPLASIPCCLASPITYVSKESAPVLLIHDPKDRTVPFEQSQVFEKKLKEAQVKVRLLALPGADHDFDVCGTKDHEKKATEAALAFLAEHFAPKKR